MRELFPLAQGKSFFRELFLLTIIYWQRATYFFWWRSPSFGKEVFLFFLLIALSFGKETPLLRIALYFDYSNCELFWLRVIFRLARRLAKAYFLWLNYFFARIYIFWLRAIFLALSYIFGSEQYLLAMSHLSRLRAFSFGWELYLLAKSHFFWLRAISVGWEVFILAQSYICWLCELFILSRSSF